MWWFEIPQNKKLKINKIFFELTYRKQKGGLFPNISGNGANHFFAPWITRVPLTWKQINFFSLLLQGSEITVLENEMRDYSGNSMIFEKANANKEA